MVSITRRTIGSENRRCRLASPTKRSGSVTSKPEAVKLITNAIRAGSSTDRLISTKAGNRNAQATRLRRKVLLSLA